MIRSKEAENDFLYALAKRDRLSGLFFVCKETTGLMVDLWPYLPAGGASGKGHSFSSKRLRMALFT
jgi:hypothetical protein